MHLCKALTTKLKFGSFACTDNYWEDYTDDLGVLAAAVAAIATYITKDVKAKAAKKMKDWFGD